MQMTFQQTGVTLPQVQAMLMELARRGADLREPLDEIGDAMVSKTVERFDTGVGPDGVPWPPSYRVQHGQGQAKTLVDQGHLRDSFSHNADTDSVSWGTNVIYAAIHQQGGTITAKNSDYLVFQIAGRFSKKKSVDIPARPFLGVDDDDEDNIIDILGDYLQGSFQ